MFKYISLSFSKEPKPALFYDDKRARISWRGDGEYFVTSSIHTTKGMYFHKTEFVI